MPIINIKLAKPEFSSKQKEELVLDITNLLHEKYNKPKQNIVIILEDIEPFNIAFGGESVEKLRLKSKK
ncbi:4-oxalocrotonate tautomerase family protein [Campylobacter insulaenigrae]|uniref:4-oxalocrotonate tautomerase family enzyme n=2 Tax=Campylobacter insulaenigrae TaxID=260714 RepID=A0A0A8H5U6_9BACT|nr:4-oxalocrotonate tautomerase family protein [Campylobacter insulaenigrae]AJC88304.1 4-oxalocrotonate tautomerase family enzyme [Campylobacter insulaenigrae NCTC 12927]MCR6570974.1 4-oxalocrotonate tautomerase family protein [Campylobacter insulaenigrae]MCR6572606.1 4-oxalocrotonate tautomerase family protein [Campylobacter insulaenigrae]MCR6573908.1 4-oxalocrotonate tautomerase family protein [Campylobacter insulaenigrae]MCR6575698.1 4-oxalocrotonate tautomerase family protein [Campylobacte